MHITIDNFAVEKTLGSGISATVYLVRDQRGTQYAMKVFDMTHQTQSRYFHDCFYQEVQLMRGLYHENMINIRGYSDRAVLLDFQNNQQQKKVAYILMDYAEHGELFDFIAH